MGAMCMSWWGHTLNSKFFFSLLTSVMQVLSWGKPLRLFFYLAITNTVDLANISGFLPIYFFHFVFYRLMKINKLHLRSYAKKRKGSLPGDDKLWKFHRLLSDGLIVTHCLDIFLLTFMCIKNKFGIWNFAFMKPSKKQYWIYWGHFLSISWNSGHSKKDDIEERCKKIMVEKAEEKKSLLGLSSYSTYCTVSEASPCLEGTIYP